MIVIIIIAIIVIILVIIIIAIIVIMIVIIIIAIIVIIIVIIIAIIVIIIVVIAMIMIKYKCLNCMHKPRTLCYVILIICTYPCPVNGIQAQHRQIVEEMQAQHDNEVMFYSLDVLLVHQPRLPHNTQIAITPPAGHHLTYTVQ